MVKTLYLVRHAHYRIPHPKSHIREDLGGTVLTIEGIENIIKLAHKLRHDDRDIKRIYSSPYQRTLETSKLLARVLRADIEVRDDIQEQYTGKGTEDHLKEVYTKFKRVVEEALEYTEGNCILVSHMLPISLYVSRESGTPYKEIAENTKHVGMIKMGDCYKLLYNRKDFIKYEKL